MNLMEFLQDEACVTLKELERENLIQGRDACMKTLIKASEMLVAPRISECFGLL